METTKKERVQWLHSALSERHGASHTTVAIEYFRRLTADANLAAELLAKLGCLRLKVKKLHKTQEQLVKELEKTSAKSS
jgi:hypothetical protein